MDNQVIEVNKLIEDNTITAKNKINWSKLLTLKNLKIIVLIIVAIFTIWFISKLGDNVKTENNDVIKTSTGGFLTTMEYCQKLESKMENVLSQIKGAGQVKVMLSLEGSPELIYATEDDSKVSSNNSGSTSTNSSAPIIIDSSSGETPLVLTEKLPNVKGVIVVSSGASDIGIKLDILNAVSTLLNISTDKISVLKGN